MKKKIRVLSVGHSYVVAMNRSILREISLDSNFEVTVAAPNVFKGSLRTIKLEDEPEDSKINLVSIRAYMTRKMHIFAYDHFQLTKLFQKGKFDCAHFWEEPYIFAGYQLSCMAQKSKTPYLFRTAQSLIKDYTFPFSYFEKKSLLGAKCWVAGGHLVYNAMIKKGWAKPGQVLTLAVDTKKFKPFDSLQKKNKRNQLNLKGPVIGYLGRLSEEKGCDLFMDVLLQLKEKPWSFLVMGSGPYKEKIENWAKLNGLEKRVKVMLVDHSEVPNVLPVCDLLICPSQTRKFWKEQFGRMIVEGFAAGVPVMASDSGEIPRVVDQAGVILKEDDSYAWRDALESFIDHPENFEKYKKLGLQRVKKYSASAIAEQYKQVYSELAGV